MRKFGCLLVAVALTVPGAALVAQSADAAVTKVSCKTGTTKSKIVPGLWKLQPPAQAGLHKLKQKITATGTLGGCTGGVTGGSVSLVFTVGDPTNCNELVDSKAPAANPPTTGPVVITWAGGKGKTTIGKATLGGVTPFKLAELQVTGKVTASTGAVAGLKGKTFKSRVKFTAVPSTGCISTNLVAATTKAVTPATIS